MTLFPLVLLHDEPGLVHLRRLLMLDEFTDLVHSPVFQAPYASPQGPAALARGAAVAGAEPPLASHHTVCGLPAEGLQAVLAARQAGGTDGPLSWFAPLPAAGVLPGLLQAGLTGWWPETMLAPGLLRAALECDGQRWQAGQAQAAELARQRGLLDDRRWVERAKGVLMQPRGASPGLGEDEAFALLRSAAMHAKLRLADLSRAVVQTLHWAEAINRAGQLRMLSQRLVKLAAQRLAQIDAKAALVQQQAAAQRVQDNLVHLDRLRLATDDAPADGALWGEPLATAHAAWSDLQTALAKRLSPDGLARADGHAEALLDAAEALTDALQASGGRPALQLVNLCGRQRMWVQRLAKQALLGSVLGQPQRLATLAPLVLAIDDGVATLAASPLTSAEIRSALDAVREHWQRMRLGLRGDGGQDGLAMLARASDQLLDILDQLTADYERSLQLIMA
jgi:ANTAR domain/Type IV pili methyl-accepting chemotaxis transducer N-term